MEKLTTLGMTLGTWAKQRWWLILLIFFAIGSALNAHEPEWYRDEAATMERMSSVIGAPVPYLRKGEGFGNCYHVDAIFLPPVSVDREMAQAIAEEVRELPQGTWVICQHVPNRKQAINELNRALAGHAVAGQGPGFWSVSTDELQRATYVAGIHERDR